jgi:hypothetical protein
MNEQPRFNTPLRSILYTFLGENKEERKRTKEKTLKMLFPVLMLFKIVVKMHKGRGDYILRQTQFNELENENTTQLELGTEYTSIKLREP